MKNLIKTIDHHCLHGFHSFNSKQARGTRHLLDAVFSQWNIILLLLILLVPIFPIVAQGQKAIKAKLQEDKVYFTPQLAGSSPTTKPTYVKMSIPNREEKSSAALEIRPSNNSSSSMTLPQLKAYINASQQALGDVTIYTGISDQCASQIASDGNEMFVAFETFDTESGSYPVGSIKVYRSTDGGASWNYWRGIFNLTYHLSLPQIVIAGGYIVVSYQSGGDLFTARWRRSDLLFSNSSVSTPITSATEYIVNHRVVSDVEQYPSMPWLYIAYLLKQADGTNEVMFSFSKDTANTWGTYTLVGVSQSELGKDCIGFDYGKSGLYLAYLGTGTNAGNILIRKSTDLGVSWTSEQILPTDVYGGTNKKVGPMVAAVGQRVAIVYQYDYNGTATDWKTSGTGGDFDINAIVSYDGGTNWYQRLVGGTTSNEILPWVTHDADSSFYVSFIKDGRSRISMGGDELAFSIPDSSSSANVSLDYFPSVFGSNIPGTKTAYATWTGLSIGLDVYGANVALKVPPLSPANLVASVVSSTQIKLSWTDNSFDETGFIIYYRKTGSGAVFAQQGVVGVGVTSSSITGLSSSTGYEFYVRAFNANGLSLRTNIVSATTQSGGTAIPTITSFTPTSGPIGTIVTITGTNFDPTAANNIVYFGAVMAQVISSSAASLKVTVPVGATYQPITVTVNGLTAYSITSFIVTFNGGGTITNSSFSTKVDFAPGAWPEGVTIGDIDGDGKPDMVVANGNSGTVSVFRNTSSSGSMTSGSFAANIDFTAGTTPLGVAIVDIDGDGKSDLVVVNANSNTVSVFRNTSSVGSITSSSFAAKVDFATGTLPDNVAIGDIDGDGKPDMVVVNRNSNTVSVFRNTSSSGSITSGSFAAKVDFATEAYPIFVAIGDIDGDGKPDMVVVNANSYTVSVFRNASSVGSITSSSFDAKIDFATGSNPFGVAIVDIDGDGKLDLVVGNAGINTISVFRNTSSSGSITSGSFAGKVDFSTGAYPSVVAIGDIDGDGRPDLAVSNFSGNSVSVFRNMSSSGSITSGSLAAKVDFATGTSPWGIAIGDIDGDGKPDLVVGNYGSNTVSVFRNTIGSTNTAPAAPQNLFATAGNGQVTLKWNKNKESDFLRYRIYRGTSSNPTTKVDSSTASILDTVKLITGLTNSTTYYFRITAVDNAGLESGFSNEVSATPNAVVDNTPPVFTVSPYTTGTPVLVDANGLVSSSPQVNASASDAGSGISGMQVAYRNTSEKNWLYSPYVSANTISYQIPATEFTYNNKPIGVNYCVGAWDNAGNVTWSPYNSIDVQLGPQATDQTDISMMPAASKLSNKTTAYRIVSVPYDLPDKKPVDLLSNFGNHMENTVPYVRWRFQRYDKGQYQDYDQFSTEDVITPGAAFFFIVRDQGSQIVVKGASVARSDVMYNTGIQLQSGWNLVGNPFNIPYPIDSLEFYATASSVRQPIRQHAYYSGTGSIGGWDTSSASVSQIQPWSGIAAYVNSAGTLKFPSTGQRSGLPKTSRVSSVPPIEKEAVGNWTLAVNAYRSDIDMRCEGSSLGMAQGANEGDDPYDSYIPPIVGDKNVAVYFKNADGAMMRDIRPPNEDGDVWEMRVVTGDAGAKVKLQWGNNLNLPNPAFEAYLIDTDQKMAHNLKEVQSLEINSGNGIRNFRVVVGKKSFVEGNNAGVALTPSSMKLYANYPNPFNPETVIRYTVPDASASYTVTLKIFNVLGQEIATLVREQKSAGYYEVKWNALQQSSGIYFYRLSITDGSKTFQDIKKMVLMK